MSIWEKIKNKWNSIFNKNKTLPEGEEIELDLSGSEHQIGVLNSPMGEGRHDKSVYVKGKDGNFTRTSNIMFGKKETSLTDKAYISQADVEEALTKYFTPAEEGEVKNIIVKAKKTGEKVDVEELKSLVLDAAKAKGEILIAGGMPTITNQETASLYVKEAGEKDFARKGILFLGNNKIELPSGEYVSQAEVQEALKEYMKEEVKEKEETLDEELVAEADKVKDDKEIHQITKRYKIANALPIMAAVGASVITFVLGADTIEGEKFRSAMMAKQGIEVEHEEYNKTQAREITQNNTEYERPQNIPENRRKYVEEWNRINKKKDEDLDR